MTMKELLQKKLSERQADLTKLEEALKTMEIEEERKKCVSTIDTIKSSIAEITAALNEEARQEAATVTNAPAATRDEGQGTMDYRTAFMHYVTRGESIPMELRDTTKTTDIGVVIPENLINQIFEKFDDFGQFYALITKTSYPIGQTIPKDGVKPVATWVAEGAGSTKQKKTANGAFTFANYKLRCEVALTEESAVMGLPAFEALFVKQVSEAMVKAIEAAVISGDGTSQPTGILTVAGTTVTVNNEALIYADLIEAEAAIRADKENTAKWFMTKKTFMAFMAMVDGQGQPIARINYGIAGKPERYLLGREVVLLTPAEGSKLTAWSTASATGDIVAFICDPADYVLNTNYNLGVSSRVNWDNEDHETKAVMACDGKFVEDTDALVLVKVAVA